MSLDLRDVLVLARLEIDYLYVLCFSIVTKLMRVLELYWTAVSEVERKSVMACWWVQDGCLTPCGASVGIPLVRLWSSILEWVITHSLVSTYMHAG
jgi:hypothetical protein